jgi:putative heme iron utilization protein
MPGAMDQHQPPTAAPMVAPVPAPLAPSYAVQARSLLAGHDRGSLATLHEDGHPFGSVVLYVPDAQGNPVMLLSEIAEHTRNARRDRRASLLVTAGVSPGDDAMAAARVTLVGGLDELTPKERASLGEAFLDAHPSARSYASFGDFRWWRLTVESVRFVGGYGRMGWIDTAEYAHAEVDPLASAADGIIAHMNTDHADAGLAYVRAFAGVTTATSAQLVAVDRLGMELVAATPDGLQTARVNFDAPAGTATEVRHAVVALLRKARSLDDDGHHR